MALADPQRQIDQQNREFWDELCGTAFARALGIREISAESLTRFDEAYLRWYPYLHRYIPADVLRGRRVLEIGLGYGTLGQLLAAHGCRYVGLDIAAGPVAMMRYRLRQSQRRPTGTALQGSALEIPFAGDSFDYVYSIGCLHHTGNLSRAVGEIYRVLTPGGRAVVMLYHRHSFRRLVYVPVKYARARVSGDVRHRSLREFVRGLYDADSKGTVAPHTDFVSRRDVRALFKDYARLSIESQNFDNYNLFKGRIVLRRERFLGNVGRVLGTDLYIVATK